MKKMRESRVLAVLLSAALVLGLVPTPALAEMAGPLAEAAAQTAQDEPTEEGADAGDEAALAASDEDAPVAGALAEDEQLAGRDAAAEAEGEQADAQDEAAPEADGQGAAATAGQDAATGAEEEAADTQGEAMPAEQDAAASDDQGEAAPTEQDDAVSADDSAPETSAAEAPAFEQRKTVDGVTVTVQAPEGAFPAEATLSVERVRKAARAEVEAAVDEARSDSANVAASYTFDIKVLGADGAELQPAEGRQVQVSFAAEEVANQNLETQVYHVSEQDGALAAEPLDATERGEVATVQTDGFSYYQVEFTYGSKQYVLPGDESVALTEVLAEVGITAADGSAATDADITAATGSDDSLFTVKNEGGHWVATAVTAFTSTESLAVTVDGISYDIVVTDEITNIKLTSGNVGWYEDAFAGVILYVNSSNTFTIGSFSADCYVDGAHAFSNSDGSWSYASNTTGSVDATGKLTLTFGDRTSTFSLKSGCNAWKYEGESRFTMGGMSGTASFTSHTLNTPNVSVKGNTITYDGGTHDLVSTSGSSGTVHYRYKKSTDANYGDWNTTIPSAAESGTYTIQWYTPSFAVD